MPESYTPEVKRFLDELRISGICNMFGAGSFLQEVFGFNRKEASECLAYWMQTFGKDK